MRLDELYTTLNLQNPYTNEQVLSGVALDSRQDVLGKLFVAISGEKVDGHTFIEEAEKNGALCALVQKGYKNPYVKIPLLEVDCPVDALQKLAKEKVKKTKAQVVAITGSVGKTTVKDFTHTLISSKYTAIKTEGNQNSQIGLATSILNTFKGDEAYIVSEMGMSKKGEIRKLTEMLAPDIAVVTYIAYAHSCNFETIAEIAEAKAEIFSQGSCKTSIINYDSPQLPTLLQHATGKKITYSTESLQAGIRLQMEDNTLVIVEPSGKTTLSYLYLPAPHLYSNFLAAATVARSIGMSWEEINEAMSQLKVPDGRMQIIQKGGITFIHDAYNASEASTKAALLAMQKKYCKSKKILVLGGMKELGVFSDECHKNVGTCALSCVDRLIAFGKECAPAVQVWQDEGREVSWHEDFDALSDDVIHTVQEGDLVLLKGSRSYALERLLEAF